MSTVGAWLLKLLLLLISIEAALWLSGVFVRAYYQRDVKAPYTTDHAILCVGDSFTYGLFVAQHENYPAQLQAELKRRLPHESIDVANASYPGMNSHQALRDFPGLLDRYQPKMVVLRVGLNDEWNFEGFSSALPDTGFAFKIPRFVRALKQYLYLRFDKVEGMQNAQSVDTGSELTIPDVSCGLYDMVQQKEDRGDELFHGIIAEHHVLPAARPTCELLRRYIPAIRAFVRGEFATALPAARSLAQEQPQHPSRLFFLGMVLARSEQRPEAAQVLEEILRSEHPVRRQEVFHELGGVYVESREYLRAIAVFAAGLHRDPNDLACLRAMGQIVNAGGSRYIAPVLSALQHQPPSPMLQELVQHLRSIQQGSSHHRAYVELSYWHNVGRITRIARSRGVRVVLLNYPDPRTRLRADINGAMYAFSRSGQALLVDSAAIWARKQAELDRRGSPLTSHSPKLNYFFDDGHPRAAYYAFEAAALADLIAPLLRNQTRDEHRSR